MQDREQRQHEHQAADRDVADAAAGEHGVEHERRQQGGPPPQDQHAAPLTVPHLHQAVVQVALVGRCHTLTFGGTADDREQGVEDGHSEDEQRDEQRREEEVRLPHERLRVRVGAPTDDARAHRHQQPQQQRSPVAHEDASRVEVVWQEPEADADREDRHHRAQVGLRQHADLRVGEPLGVQEEGTGADRDDPGREAVETVDQVDGVRHAQQPQHRDERHPLVAEEEHVDERDTEVEHRDAEVDENRTDQDRAGHLRRRGDLANVVDETDDEDQRRGEDRRAPVDSRDGAPPARCPPSPRHAARSRTASPRRAACRASPAPGPPPHRRPAWPTDAR